MFGARFAVFVRRARVLPGPCPATRNLSFWRFHRHRHPVVSTCCFTGLVWVGVKIPPDGNRTNGYGHMAVAPEHGWRCCPAHVMQLVICRSGGFTGAVTCCCSVFVMAAGSLLNPFQTVFEAKLATIMASVETTHTVLVLPHCTI